MPIEGGTPRQITFLESDYAFPAWSPDGKAIAFISLERGTPRIWSIELQEGTSKVFEQAKPGLSIIWNPGEKILYQRPSRGNYALLDPLTEEETDLVKDGSAGWISSPVYSPDSSQVAVYWRRGAKDLVSGARKESGLYIISLKDSTHRRIIDGYWRPIGWSENGSWVYATSLSERTWSPTQQAKLMKIKLDNGRTKEMFTLPSEISWCEDVLPDEERILCVAIDYQTDIWVAESFDPDED